MSGRPGERQQKLTHVGDRQLSDLWEEVCRLRASEATLKAENERLNEVISNMAGRVEAQSWVDVKCWRRERHVGKECLHGETSDGTG